MDIKAKRLGDQADYFDIDGVRLPNTFANRAVWVRHAFCKNPEASSVCNDGLVWMQYGDGYWYSVAGNWSSYSPAEKIRKAAARERERIEAVQTAEEYYEQILYQSKIRQLVLDRDGNTCQICHKIATSALHVHHILKRKEGGTDHLDNLLTVCSRCHKPADTKLYDPEWTNPRGIAKVKADIALLKKIFHGCLDGAPGVSRSELWLATEAAGMSQEDCYRAREALIAEGWIYNARTGARPLWKLADSQ